MTKTQEAESEFFTYLATKSAEEAGFMLLRLRRPGTKEEAVLIVRRRGRVNFMV